MTTPTAYESWLARAMELADSYATMGVKHGKGVWSIESMNAARDGLEAHLRKVPFLDESILTMPDGRMENAVFQPDIGDPAPMEGGAYLCRMTYQGRHGYWVRTSDNTFTCTGVDDMSEAKTPPLYTKPEGMK